MGSHGKSRSPSRSRSPSPGRKRHRSRSWSPSRSRSFSPRSRSRSRSRSPAKRRGYRDRRRSYSRSPSPAYHRRHRRSPSWERDLSPPPLFRHRGYDRHNPPCSLLVRNISRDARPEDIRGPFERFGHVKDVYLPKDYYTGEPRGFGFVQFRDPNDAADAKYNLDRTIVGGREITVVFAEENRKKPQEMRKKQRSRSSSLGGGRSLDRRSPPRSSRLRSNSYSRSPSPRR